MKHRGGIPLTEYVRQETRRDYGRLLGLGAVITAGAVLSGAVLGVRSPWVNLVAAWLFIGLSWSAVTLLRR